MSYAPQQAYSQAPAPPPTMTMTPPESEPNWRTDSVANLTDALGELKIDHTAIGELFESLTRSSTSLTLAAPYITNMKKTLAETPAQEEYEVQLPPSVSLDHTVRIPPEMMPSEEQALHYFEYFFANVHPYCPVINAAYFYQQWHNARDSISPLMLEAMFACSTLILGDIDEGNKWLALATSQSLLTNGLLPPLTVSRTRRKLQRCITPEYNAGNGATPEGPRGVAETRLLLALVDGNC